MIQKSQLNKTLQVSLVGYLPAIIPSYGDASEKFCQLEAGYMLPLLEKSLAEKGYGLVNNKEQSLISGLDKKDNILLGQYEIIEQDRDLAFNSLSKYVLLRKDQTNDDLAYQLYHWQDGALSLVKEFEPDDSFFNQKGDNGIIIANSRAFLLFSEEEKFADYCAIGYQSQLFMELSSLNNIGSCALGYLPLDVKLQEILGNEFIQTAIALGKVTDDQVASIYTEKVKVENLEEDKDHTIKGYLQHKLPSYMIPEYLIELDKLPLSANGKVDRKALPEPDVSLMAEEFVAPRSEIEKKLVDIWKSLLGLDTVSIHDGFFQLGGDSLSAITMVNKVNQEFPIDIKISDIFRYSSVSKLSNFVDGLLSAGGSQDKTKKVTKHKVASDYKDVNKNFLEDDIAIVGIAIRVPGASNHHKFWDNLKNDVESIQDFTDEELIDAGVDEDLLKDSNYVKRGGVIDKLEYFVSVQVIVRIH